VLQWLGPNLLNRDMLLDAIHMSSGELLMQDRFAVKLAWCRPKLPEWMFVQCWISRAVCPPVRGTCFGCDSY
jgi:hypothetical protein